MTNLTNEQILKQLGIISAIYGGAIPEFIKAMDLARSDERSKYEKRIEELERALNELLKGIKPEDACYGKFANFFPVGSKEHEEQLKKPYVGSKSIPTDAQILNAIDILKK